MLLFEKLTALFSSETLCPQFQTKCRKHKCPSYMMLQGTDSENGAPVQVWGCTIYEHSFKIQHEQANFTRCVQAAVEDFRNQTIEQNERIGEQLLLVLEIGMKQIAQTQEPLGELDIGQKHFAATQELPDERGNTPAGNRRDKSLPHQGADSDE